MKKYKTVRLGDVFDLQMGKTPDRKNLEYFQTNENKWISIADISKAEKYISETKECISDEAVTKSGIKQIPTNTLIMSFKLSIGKTAITKEPMYSNEAIMSFLPNGKYETSNDFLYHLFSNKDWSEGSNKAVKGITLNKASLQEAKISLPPLSEQRHIASVLDKCTELIAKYKQMLEKYDTLIKSRFIEMFGESKFELVSVSSICDFITKGTTPPTNEIKEDSSEDSIPYLKVYNLSFSGELLFKEKPQYISREIHNNFLARSKVFPNDVLMNIVGPPLGKFSLVPSDFTECNINQAIAIFRAKDKVIPLYLLHALMFPDTLRPIINSAVGIRQQNLSLEQCRNLQIPLPPIELQKDFATFVQQIDKSKFAVQKSIEKTESLYKSLMQEYFE